MKRLLSTVLTMLLIITALCPAAMATEGVTRNKNITFSQELSLTMIASTSDTVYAMLRESITGNNQIHAWKVGTDEAVPVITEGLTMYAYDDMGKSLTTNMTDIIANDDELYGYDSESSSIRKLIDADGNPTSTDILYYIVDTKAEGEDANQIHFDVIVAKDDVLYTGQYVYVDNRGSMRVVSRNINSGEVISQADLPLTQYFTPIGYNKLILVQADHENAYNAETGEYEPAGLVYRDMTTGESEGIGYTKDINDTCISYLAENNTIYFASGTSVYAYKDMTGDYQLSAYMPSFVSRYSYGAALAGGLFVSMSDNNTITVRELDSPTLSEGALTMYAVMQGDEHFAFINAHPEIAVANADINFEGVNDYYTMMVSADASVDIVNFTSYTTPIGRLIQKGYAADLSGYPELMELTAAMPDTVKDMIMKDGKLYGVPTMAAAQGYGYINETLELLGLTHDDMPKTFLELLEFMASFQENYGESHPDVMLFENMDMSASVLSDLTSLYIAHQMRAGEVVTMDTPLFRKLMAAYESIDFAEIDPYGEYGDEIWSNETLMNEFYQKSALLSNYVEFNSPTTYNPSANYTPLVLPLDEGLEPIGELTMTILVLNPHSTHKDTAALYMAEYMKNYSIRSSYAFRSDYNETAENPFYESTVRSMESDIEMMENRLNIVGAEEKAVIEDTLKLAKESLSKSEQWKMLVSEEGIKAYRENIFPYFYATPMTPLRDWSGTSAQEFGTLSSQYLDKAITLDGYIQEMDKRLTMMRLED